MKKTFFFTLIIVAMFSLSSCEGGLNLFSIQDEIQLGQQVLTQVRNDPAFPVLPRSGRNIEIYEYMENIMNILLQSPYVRHRDTFDWRITIIDDNVLNAFAAPGGQLFFYTGFLRYVRSEAELAGVVAHEIAHSDKRHSTQNMTRVYGISALLSIVLGNNPGLLAQIAADLATNLESLRFSRQHEYEADEYAVRYKHSVRHIRNWHPTALVDFFDRLYEDNLSGPASGWEFLRTHPYDENRRAHIFDVWQSLGSPEGYKFEAEHTRIVRLLP